MIGDKRRTEALGFQGIRPLGAVGERCSGVEAGVKTTVELLQVRMQT